MSIELSNNNPFYKSNKILQNKIIFDALFLLMLFIGLLFPIILRDVFNLDELWSFSFAKNINNGLLPYRDFNMITTPLSAFIQSLFLTWFGGGLLSSKIISLLTATIIFFLYFKLCILVGCNKINSAVASVFSAMFFSQHFIYNYNYLVLLFLLCVIYLDVKISKSELNNYHLLFFEFSIGFISALAVLTKQSTGFVIVIAILITALLNHKKTLILYRLLGLFIPAFAFFIYLLLNNIINDFLSYSVYGLAEFQNNYISYFDFLKTGLINFIIGMSIPIVLIFFTIKIIQSSPQNLTHLKIVVFCCAGLATIYPIADADHMYIAAFPFTLMLYLLVRGKIKIKYPPKAYLCVLISFAMFFISTICFVIRQYNDVTYSTLKHFEGVRINRIVEERIYETKEFIIREKETGNEVYILDAAATICFIPLDIYHKDYNMFLRGNLGNKTPHDSIKKLLNKSNSVLLLPYDTSQVMQQVPTEVYDDVKQEFYKSGQVGIYDVYRKK